MNNSDTNINLLKWIILGIMVYFNIGYLLGFVQYIITVFLSISQLPVWAYGLNDSCFYLLKIIVLSYLFGFLLKHLQFQYQTIPINKFLLINTIILPVFFLMNLGLNLLIKIFLQKKFNVEFYTQYAMFNAIASAVENFINIILLLTFGIIMLMQKTPLDKEIVTK